MAPVTIASVSAQVSSGFTAMDQNSNSANDSRKHAIENTRKASSRVKQEHKVDNFNYNDNRNLGNKYTSSRKFQPDRSHPDRLLQHDAQMACRALPIWVTAHL